MEPAGTANLGVGPTQLLRQKQRETVQQPRKALQQETRHGIVRGPRSGVDWRLMLIVALLVPAVFGIVWLYQRLSAPAVTKSRALRSELNAQAAESIAGMAVVQASGAAAAFAERFAATNAAHYAARRLELRANAWLLRPALDLLNVAMLGAVIMVFSWRSGLGGDLGVGLGGNGASGLSAIEVGVLYAFVSTISRVVEPLIQITTQFSQLQQAVVAAARVNTLLDEAEAPQALSTAQVSQGAISVRGLDFATCRGGRCCTA